MDYNIELDRRISNSECPETWVLIKGWEALYAISNYGRIKSFTRNPPDSSNDPNRPGRILRSVPSLRGNTRKIHLVDGRFKETCYVHRLVAEGFRKVNRKSSKVIVLHKNGINDDNFYTNMLITNRKAISKRIPTRKVICKIQDKRTRKFNSISAASEFLGINPSSTWYRLSVIPGKMVNGFSLKYDEALDG